MSVIGDLFGNLRSGYRGERDVNDERFWQTDGLVGMAASGVVVTREQAFKVSCIFQGVRLISEVFGLFPPIVYREEIDAEGYVVRKRRERGHYLWKLLQRQPNEWQTAQAFRETMTAWTISYGKAYAKTAWERDGSLRELIPIDPELVTEERLEHNRLRYRIRGEDQAILQEEMFTLKGFGLDKFVGEPVLSLARETIGLWLSHEKFRSTFFAQGATPGLWLKTPRKLSKEVYDRLKESAATRYSGPGNWHKVQIAEEGLEPFSVGFDAAKSQMSESTDTIVADVARWLNLPLHMLRSTIQSTTYASAEQFGREFIMYTMAPWCLRWEQSIDRDLIWEEGVYVEHLMDALLRPNTRERAEAQQIWVNTGVMTRNEVRRMENLNPLPGLDEPLTPLNMQRTGAEQQAQPAAPPPAPRRRQPVPEEDEDEQARIPRRLQLVMRNVARSLAHQEATQITTYATKLAGKTAAAWSDWLSAFYEAFAGTVATRLELEPSVARAYADRRREQLQILGLGAVPPNWEECGAEMLIQLANEQTEEADHA